MALQRKQLSINCLLSKCYPYKEFGGELKVSRHGFLIQAILHFNLRCFWQSFSLSLFLTRFQKFNMNLLLSFVDLRSGIMKIKKIILTLTVIVGLISVTAGQTNLRLLQFDFYGDKIELPFDKSSVINYTEKPSDQSIQAFYACASKVNYDPLVNALLNCKEKLKLDDWLYYQLIRKTVQQISPKTQNYYRYTLYKWILMTQSGYDATLKTNGDKLLFYVQSDEKIYNIPYYMKNDRQYVCLNYHDYGGHIDFEKEKFGEIIFPAKIAPKIFSYKVTQLPDFPYTDYQEKDLQFIYNNNEYHFKIKINPDIKSIFANYPVVDYESYFNIPMSDETYSSLIPSLKENLKGMSTKNGVDYLMHFTRYAFLFKPDAAIFGNEKRFSPEQTLLSDQSDCEDRAALFFFLVKEIYNLPMLVLSFPEHVTIAIKFDKPVGTPVMYNGMRYSVCEPTPQHTDLKLGKLLPSLQNISYQIAYVYTPALK